MICLLFVSLSAYLSKQEKIVNTFFFTTMKHSVLWYFVGTCGKIKRVSQQDLKLRVYPISHMRKRWNAMVGAVIEQSTAALRVAGSILARKQYLYSLQVVVPDLAVCVCVFSI